MVAKSASIGMVLVLAGTALAQNEIRVRAWCGANYQDTHYDAGDPIDIDVTGVGGCPDHINIWDRTGSPTHDIGPVYLYGSRSTDITVTISSGAWRGLDDTQHAKAGGNWDGITASPGVEDHVLLEGHVGGNLTGLISVGEVYRLDIDGQVQAGIQANTAGLGPFWLYAGSIGSNGNATSIADSIARVETTVGDMAGRISAAGAITNIIVADDIIASQSGPHIEAGGPITNITASGDIGTSTAFAEITTTADGGDILLVKAANIYADIATPNTANFRGDVKRIETTASAGVFKGSLTTFSMEGTPLNDPCMLITGDLTADVDAAGSIKRPVTISGDLSGRMRIGGDLKAEAPVTVGGELTGQITINALAGVGLWSGNVTVDSTVLSPKPNYAQTAASLGGGAVGLVPFGTHHESCVPVHGLEKAGAPASITLQFYGPVMPADNTKMPVRVYRGPFGSDSWGAFTDVTASFDVEYPTDRKQIRVVPDIMQFKPRYRYRIVPIISSPGTGETLLLCDDLLTSSDVPVYGEDYWVDVEVAMTTLDLSENEWVDEPDLVLWAADPQDFDGSGVADAGDLLIITDNLGEPID